MELLKVHKTLLHDFTVMPACRALSGRDMKTLELWFDDPEKGVSF